MKTLKSKKFFIILLTPFTFLMLQLSDSHHGAVERFYSRAIYPVLYNIFGRLTSLVPFSLAEFVLIVVIILSVYCVIQLIKNMRINKTQREAIFKKFVVNTLCTVSVGYFVWAMIVGFNYQRLTFAEQSGLYMHVRPSSVEELIELSEYLVAAVNESRLHVTEDENGVMVLSASNFATARAAQQTFPKAAEIYPVLSGYVARPKPSLLSELMSWFDIGGVYFPFTFEANVNVHMPDHNIPATMMHELAHFKGFMREDEANFIAYVTGRESGHPDFVYSANLMAMIYTTNALFRVDRDTFWELMEELSPAVQRDLAYSRAYWSRFEGPAAQVTNVVNNVYLRANNQPSGVRSYGQMVDLLLAEWRAKGRL